MFDMLSKYLEGTRKSIRMFIYTYNSKTNHYGTHPKTCTGSYKIAPNHSVINKLIKLKLGIGNKRIPNNIMKHIYIGYSKDEIHRADKMKKYENENTKYFFPLIDKNLDYIKTIEYLNKNNRSIKRSACFMCPFRNDSVMGMGWIDIFKDDYINFEKLIRYDVDIRNCDNSKKFEYGLYFDGACIPLWILYGYLAKENDNYKDWKKLKKSGLINDLLLDYCQKKDKKGILAMKRKNRKWKKIKIRACSSSLTGGCGL